MVRRTQAAHVLVELRAVTTLGVWMSPGRRIVKRWSDSKCSMMRALALRL